MAFFFSKDICGQHHLNARLAPMPIYLCHWPSQGYFKLGWAADVAQRCADSFADNSHPKELCNKLTRDHFILLGVYEGTENEEQELQKQFNEGTLSRKDNANEFYPDSEYQKIFRELETYHRKLPTPTNFPQPSKDAKRSRYCCRGWKHWMKMLRCSMVAMYYGDA